MTKSMFQKFKSANTIGQMFYLPNRSYNKWIILKETPIDLPFLSMLIFFIIIKKKEKLIPCKKCNSNNAKKKENLNTT